MEQENKMKRLVLTVILIAAAAGASHALTTCRSGAWAAETGLAYNKTYTLDLDVGGGCDSVAASMVYSSATIPAVTFTNGSVSTGQITVSSNAYIRASAPTIKINAIKVSYTPATTATGTAKAISDAINASTPLSPLVVSSWATNAVVYATSTNVGATVNYTMTSSSPAALGVSAATMTGGTASAYAINTPTITIASNGLPLGLQVLYTGSPAISGLTTGTTYFVSSINPDSSGLSNTFKLSTTSARAIAGTGIVLASSRTLTTASTYTLTPLPITGTPSGVWQVSDDGTNYSSYLTTPYSVAIGSQSLVSPYTASSVNWDFGQVNHHYLRWNAVAPTTGAEAFTLSVNQKTGKQGS